MHWSNLSRGQFYFIETTAAEELKVIL